MNRRHLVKINWPGAASPTGPLAAFVLGKILEIFRIFLRFFLRARSRSNSMGEPGLGKFICARCLSEPRRSNRDDKLAFGDLYREKSERLFGGAFNPEVSPEDIGRENIRIARRMLDRKQVQVVSEDVGGRRGRKIIFNTATNEIGVLKVEQLRRVDWYPYSVEDTP